MGPETALTSAVSVETSTATRPTTSRLLSPAWPRLSSRLPSPTESRSPALLSLQLKKIVSQKVICAENVKKISYTPIAASILEKCQVTKHSMIRQAGKLCISQIPIVECGSGCASGSTIIRSVPFTCLPSNRERVSKLYTEKVVRGEILPELRNMEKTFAAKMHVPVSC